VTPLTTEQHGISPLSSTIPPFRRRNAVPRGPPQVRQHTKGNNPLLACLNRGLWVPEGGKVSPPPLASPLVRVKGFTSSAAG